MEFRFKIHLKEEDFYAFNCFHALESAQGKKQILKSRLLFVVIAVAMSALVLAMGMGTASVVYLVFMSVFTIIFMVQFKNNVRKNIRKQIENMKKSGKLPYDTVSDYVFSEERFVEISESRRLEQGYDTIERLCIDGESYLILYYSAVTACILPLEQLRMQVDKDAFLHFLQSKNIPVEQYPEKKKG